MAIKRWLKNEWFSNKWFKKKGHRKNWFLKNGLIVSCFFIALLCTNWAQAITSSENAAEKLLQAFVHNGSNQLFNGTFVYLFEDQLQTIKVSRELNEIGQIVETFVPLDGSQKNNSRILQNQYCLLDNGWHYQFQAMSSSFPFRVNNFFRQIQKYYDISLLDSSSSKNEIVAGYKAVRLDIQAKDPYRYGYQLWFEPDSATLLKYKLMSQKDKAVEQYMFTDIHLIEQKKKQKSSNQPNSADNSKTCLQRFNGLTEAFEQYFNKYKLPVGYEAISFRKDFIKDSERLARQFQFSDGLATVSIFIEDINKTDKVINGLLKLGPMSVAGKTIGQHQVTVLGAIPIDSALQFLDAIKP